ncbi:ATP-binding cassette domain-containing protein [uncultured Albimonas sp.]|uniref:peptidase domain-containing ABC transporter n=1 Tax=uncultured Albimonas sp. TaxID=1331701 RepID=UPI0030EE6E4E
MRKFAPLHHLSVGAASLAVNALSLSAPLFILQVYDRIIPNQSTNTAALLGLGVLVALILEAALRMARAAILEPLATRYEVSASVKAARHLFDADLSAFERISPGVHLERLSTIARRRDAGSGRALLAIYDLPFALVFLWMIWMLGGLVVAAPLVGIAVLAVAAGPASVSSSRWMSKATAIDDRRYDFLVGALSNLPSLKMSNLERPVLRRYEALQKRRLAMQGGAFSGEQGLADLSQLVVQLSIIGVVAGGSLLVLSGDMTIGALSACTLLSGRFLGLGRNLVALASRIGASNVARAHVEAIFDLPAASGAAGLMDAGKAPVALSLKGVVFAGDDGERVLDGVDLELEAGRTVGLVGDNGSGKSILLALAAGLYVPTEGEIRLAGRPLADYSPDSLRRTIALVSQQETLFAGTILDNICMFSRDRVDAALAAAEETGLADLVKPLPKGFATRVGDGAADGLPRGVSQRISLCRALALDPRILLFDDANSAIDDQGDEKVEALFARLHERCAILFVSHRPSVLGRADRILRLADGKVGAIEGGMG